jgi:serine/threonine protein kinase
VLENTQPQFPAASKGQREREREREPVPVAMVKVCGQCGSRFSGDARFCPFDAEPLHATAEESRPADPLLGSVVDERYEVEIVLGEGGMGTVYRARHRVLDKKLALKVLRADLSRDADLGLRFLREAKAAASIAHPSVVQITDFGNLPSGQPYFVMELLTGASLSQIVRKGGPIPAGRAVRLLMQMVDALAAAHQVGVVHRDLKPDNILVCPTAQGSEVVKVLDFGLAKVAGQSRLTKAGLVFGTPHYMSPEQASGGVVDERTDIYSLGIVMYEMFTGRVPFEADTYMGVLTKHLYVAPTPPSVLLGGITELGALEQVTLRCLEKKPEKRYASMRALADELGRVAKFNEAGTLTVQPTELREPRLLRLADELELPTAAELRQSLFRAGIGSAPLPRWAIAMVAGVTVLVALLAVVLLARRGASLAPGPSGAPAMSSSPPLSTASPGPGIDRRPVPAPVPRAAGAGPGPAKNGAQAAESVTLGGPGRSADGPRAPRPAVGTSRLPAPRPANELRTPTTPAKSPTGKGKMVPGEIVDPWSE